MSVGYNELNKEGVALAYYRLKQAWDQNRIKIEVDCTTTMIADNTIRNEHFPESAHKNAFHLRRISQKQDKEIPSYCKVNEKQIPNGNKKENTKEQIRRHYSKNETTLWSKIIRYENQEGIHSSKDICNPDNEESKKIVYHPDPMIENLTLSHALNSKVHRSRYRRTDYKVRVGIHGHMVTMVADTGAEINVLPNHTAKLINLPIEHSARKICPYGANPIRVIGKYEGFVSFGAAIVRSKWYIVDKQNIEPLLNGFTAEKLGIIKFVSTPYSSFDSS